MTLEHPVVTLVSGVRIANFSSAHEFVFSDGTVLPPCAPQTAEALKLEVKETQVPSGKGWTDIKLSTTLSDAVQEALLALEQRSDVDIILVPFIVLEAVRASGIPCTKARVQRKVDRFSQAVLADKFCV